ncbi:unnamed protein product [Soboliphyme baturini]|uniref:Uncharacterized protein n=1 Tax=Soboliphyme baturini TaxID=241478 RepID=A0A183JAQ9_9BILA|nr:unnamed protein product [Soboliphyme baturini]
MGRSSHGSPEDIRNYKLGFAASPTLRRPFRNTLERSSVKLLGLGGGGKRKIEDVEEASTSFMVHHDKVESDNGYQLWAILDAKAPITSEKSHHSRRRISTKTVNQQRTDFPRCVSLEPLN